MAEIGLVKAIENDKVVVSLERKEACAKCRACTAGMTKKEMIVKAYNQCKAEIGDNVEIVIDETNFINAVFIMYGIPCVAMLFGMFFSYAVFDKYNFNYKEFLSFGIGIIMVLAVYFFISRKESYFKSKNYIPRAIKKI